MKNTALLNDIGRFYTKHALPVWTNLGKHLKPAWLWVSSIKMGIRRVTRLYELYFVVRHSKRISKYSSSRRVTRLVLIFILETHNQTDVSCRVVLCFVVSCRVVSCCVVLLFYCIVLLQMADFSQLVLLNYKYYCLPFLAYYLSAKSISRGGTPI